MNIITLRAVFEAKESGRLPDYLGSTVRGVLGHCMRGFVCDAPDTKCFVCEKRYSCLYVRCFSNTGGEAGAVNPYVLYVHTKGKTQWNPGDTCTFDLTLFGEAVSWAHIYLDALLEMERVGWGVSRIPFRLLWVTEPDNGRLIYGNGRTWMRNLGPQIISPQKRNAKNALLVFDTPVRIASGGEVFEELPFQVFARFLYGRYALISKKYAGSELPWSVEEIEKAASGISVQAQEWRTVAFTRYSMNQKDNKLELPSKIGWVMYEGDIKEWIPLLEIGKHIHVGRAATIGFGHYEVFFDR